jgi:hypothetical protein
VSRAPPTGCVHRCAAAQAVDSFHCVDPNSSMPRGPACRIGVAAAVGRRRRRLRRRVVQACGTAQAPTARALSVRDRKWAGSARAASLVARSRSASAVNSVPRLQPTTTPSRARARRGRRGRRARRSLLDWRGHPVSPAMSRVFTGLSCTKVSTQGPWRVSDCTRSNTRRGPSLRRHGHRAVVASASGSTSTIATS